MIILLIVGIAVAVLGALIAAVAVAVACMQDKGRRCAYRRPSAAAILAADLWHWARPLRRAAAALAALDGWLRGGEFLLPPAPYLEPIVTDAEVREEDERLAAERDWPADWPHLRIPRSLPPGSHPYPELRPTVLPRDRGDGHIIIDQAERLHVLPAAAPPPVVHPTLYDLPVVPRYALALGPDGCEET